MLSGILTVDTKAEQIISTFYIVARDFSLAGKVAGVITIPAWFPQNVFPFLMQPRNSLPH